MAYGAGDNPHAPKVVRRRQSKAAPPPNFPKFVPSHPTETPADRATSVRKRAKRVSLSATRKRTGTDRPILVKRRQKKIKEQAPGAYYASLGPAVEHAATQQRRGEALAPAEHKPRSARVVGAVIHAGGEVAHLAGEGLTGAGKGAGVALESAVTGRYLRHPLEAVGVDWHEPQGPAKVVSTVVRNAPSDAAELAVTTPSSVAKLASTAVHDPAKVPGLLAEPYVQLYEHPGKFATEHPVSTVLMLAPAVRVPGRAAGRVARVTGKQTLVRPTATLPGTALRAQRKGSRDITVRAIQSRADRGSETPRISDGEIKRRVDEHVAAGQQYVRRATAAAHRQVSERGLSGEEADAHISGVIGGARQHVDERFASEFGSTWHRTPGGVIVKPKGAAPAVLHASRADADAIAQRLPFDATVKSVGDQYAVVPEVAAARLTGHEKVGTSKALPARVMRVSRRLFTQTVLPTSPKWLAGQAVEGGVRAVLAGAGPVSYRRAGRLVAEMERQSPGSGKRLLERAAPGGLISRTAARGGSTRTLAEEFAGTPLAKLATAATKAGTLPGPKQVRAAWRQVTKTAFDRVNGRVIEAPTQQAMLGRALRDHPLMERKVFGLSDQAIEEAARGLHGTEAQVQLAREVQKMYGKYAAFGPDLRSFVMHWTPFLPWYLNVARFLGHTLPVEHPLHAALIADASAAEEDWRKASRLSLQSEDRVPSYLLGSYPVGEDQFRRLAGATPFGIGEDVSGALVGLVLPQFSSAEAALRGDDWTGKPLGGHRKSEDVPQLQRGATAGHELVRSLVPGVAVTEGAIKRGPAAQFIPFRATAKVKRTGLQLRDAEPLKLRDGEALTLR